jgi:serine/threonine protein phosphatase 1
MLTNLFRAKRPAAPDARAPDGVRIYAVGDIHGRLDLLDRLLAIVDADDRDRGGGDTRLVFLGDYVDRGPASAGVVERLAALGRERPGTCFLAGNHEEVMLRAIAGEPAMLRAFCRIGGRDTLLSYGVDAAAYERMGYDEVAAVMMAAVPAAHLAFLNGLADRETLGDYLFVHAGVDPAVPLDEQRTQDLRWIRAPFLDHRGPLGKVVVHGHTIRPDVEYRPHRIGIDTGAYETGRLTALGLEGADRWVVQT